MADPIHRRDEFHSSPPINLFSPQLTRRRVDFAGGNGRRTLSPDSCASSSTTTTEYSMLGKNTRFEGFSPFLAHPRPKMSHGLRHSGIQKETRVVNVKNFQHMAPNHDKKPEFYPECGFRSRSLEPSPYNSFKQNHVPTAPILTPNFLRAGLRQQPQVAFNTAESDYETPEKIWRRAQRIVASIRGTGISQYPHRNLPNKSRSASGDTRPQIDSDITPKPSPRTSQEVTPKATPHFGARRRFTGLTAPVRRELLAPQIQRKNIRSVKTDDEDSGKEDDDSAVKTKPTTLAEVLKQRNGIYEIEEPKLTGPSNLLHALKEVKYAEKEQLGSAPQTEIQRVTLFDLINEKERRHRLRSPPPIPPKPLRQNVSLTNRSPSKQKKQSENSLPKTVGALKYASIIQDLPSLSVPLKSFSPKKAIEVSADVYTSTPVVSKSKGDENIENESTPSISSNPFVQWDRLRTQPLFKLNNQATCPEGKSASPCSYGVGTDGLYEEGPVTVSSTTSTNTSNSLSSPEWPQPEKITARPQSHQCVPDPLDEQRLRRKVSKATGNGNTNNHANGDGSSVRVSLIAAPKAEALNFESNFIDAASNASNSSRASTVFSYPWDLPLPQSDPPSTTSSESPSGPLKWATLQRHLSDYETLSRPQDSTPKANPVESKKSEENVISDNQRKNGLFKLPRVLLNEVDSQPLEKTDGDKNSSGDEQFFEILRDVPKIHDDETSSCREAKDKISQRNPREEGPYDTIVDDSMLCSRTVEGVSSKIVPSPNVNTSPAASMEISQNLPPQQYVYAEIKLSSDTSTSSSLAVHTPPIPTHPSKCKSRMPVPETQVYDEIENKKEPVKSREISFNLPSTTSNSTASVELANTLEGKIESRSNISEFGKYLERFVCGLTTDKNTAFCKHVTTFIDSTIKQLGDTPQMTLQNVRQFMDGATNFLKTSHETELQEVVEEQRKDLRGLQYLDVARELEGLIQGTVLRPLHRKLLENIQKHGRGIVSPENAREFTNLVKKECQTLPNLNEVERRRLESQLFEPVKRMFAQLSRSPRPTDKLNHLVDILQCIDSQVQISLSSEQLKDSSETSTFCAPTLKLPIFSNSNILSFPKLAVYAIVFALTDLLKPSNRISTKSRNQKREGRPSNISQIEVHRLYLEALISPSSLASSAEGCRRLTDLICLLRYVENFSRHGSPANAICLLCLLRIKPPEMEEIPYTPNLYKLRRSFTDNIQDALQRNANISLATGSFSPLSWKKSFQNTLDREESAKSPSSASVYGTSFIVLAANEVKKTLVPFEVPLRSSLTVRELCNMLTLKLAIFDSKEFTLFFHSGSADIPMSDHFHLELFLTPNHGEGCALSADFLASIDSFGENSSQSSTPKLSTIRRLFQRRKRMISTDSSLRWLESPKSSRRSFIVGQNDERRPSIDWSSLSRNTPHFVFIYRRRSSDAVLYASDLFECLPAAGKLI